MEAISDELMLDNGSPGMALLPPALGVVLRLSMGKPSTTYSGWLEAFIELVPLTLIRIPPPGALDAAFISTPDALPCKDWTKVVDGVFSSSDPFTEETDPVRSFFRTVPYP